MISELHQKLLNNYAGGDVSVGPVLPNGIATSLAELKENEQMLISENKLLEVRKHFCCCCCKFKKLIIFILKGTYQFDK